MKRLIYSLPNTITILRILIALYSVYLIIDGNKFLGIILFFFSAISDFLDGYLARRYNCVTEFGKLLDPISDKIVVLAGFSLLAFYKFLPWILVLFIACREILLTIYRFMVIAKNNIVIPARSWGKLKTGVQMATIVVGLLALLIKQWIDLGQVKVFILFLGCISLWLSFYSGYLILYNNN